MRKNDLQRDKAFRQRLAQKLEVELSLIHISEPTRP